MKNIKSSFSFGRAETAILRDAILRCEWLPEEKRIADGLREKLRGVVFATVDVTIQTRG